MEVAELTLDDIGRDSLHGIGQILEELILLVWAHQPEKIAWLTVIVIPFAMVIAIGIS